MRSPEAGRSPSFSVMSARPTVQIASENRSLRPGFLWQKKKSKIGVTTTGSAQINAAFDTDVRETP